MGAGVSGSGPGRECSRCHRHQRRRGLPLEQPPVRPHGRSRRRRPRRSAVRTRGRVPVQAARCFGQMLPSSCRRTAPCRAGSSGCPRAACRRRRPRSRRASVRHVAPCGRGISSRGCSAPLRPCRSLRRRRWSSSLFVCLLICVFGCRHTCSFGLLAVWVSPAAAPIVGLSGSGPTWEQAGTG